MTELPQSYKEKSAAMKGGYENKHSSDKRYWFWSMVFNLGDGEPQDDGVKAGPQQKEE